MAVSFDRVDSRNSNFIARSKAWWAIALFTCLCWNGTTTGQEIGRLKNEDRRRGPIHALAFSPDGKMLASAEDDSFALWDVVTAKKLFRYPEDGDRQDVYGVAFAPDGMMLATGMGDGTIRLWETSTRKETLTLEGHKEGVTSVAFAPVGKLLATASYDGTIRLWELPAGKHLRTIRGNEEGITSIAFSPDGNTIASGGIATTEVVVNTNFAPVTQSDVIRLWDVATGKQLRTLDGRGSVVAFSPDGKTLASGGITAVFHLNQKPGKWKGDDDQGSGSVALRNQIAGRMRIHAVTIEVFHMVRLWEVTTGKEITSRELRGLETVGSAVAFSPDGKVLAAGAGPVINLRSKRDGNLIWSESDPKLATLWEASTGKLLRKFDGEPGAVAFTPDGKTLATGTKDDTITLWDVARLLKREPTK